MNGDIAEYIQFILLCFITCSYAKYALTAPYAILKELGVRKLWRVPISAVLSVLFLCLLSIPMAHYVSLMKQ